MTTACECLAQPSTLQLPTARLIFFVAQPEQQNRLNNIYYLYGDSEFFACARSNVCPICRESEAARCAQAARVLPGIVTYRHSQQVYFCVQSVSRVFSHSQYSPNSAENRTQCPKIIGKIRF